MDRERGVLEWSPRSFGHRGGRTIAALIILVACAIYCVAPAMAAGDTPPGEEYTCTNEWTWTFSGPRGIAVNAVGEVFVADSGYDRICRFSSTGTFIRYIGSGGTENGKLDEPSGVAVDAAGNVYVADFRNRRVQKFAPTGTFLQQFGSAGTGDGQLQAPRGVAVDAAGNVYVTDVTLQGVIKFDSSGAYVRMWRKADGTSGTGPGEFSQPYGVALDGAGNMYVADTSNKRIQKFGPTGDFILSWGGVYGTGDGEFMNPVGVTADSAGDVYVVESAGNRVQKFTGSGTFLTKWGTAGTGYGQFGSPAGVAVDAAGKVFVTQANSNRVQVFTAAPRLTAGFSADPTSGPAPLAVRFTDTSTGSPMGWAWDFGDGASDTARSPVHAFATAGTYQVTLTVTDDRGATASVTHPVTVTASNTPPVAEADADLAASEGATVAFSGSFSDAGDAGAHAATWTFGDGGSQAGTLAPTHVYADNGIYTVTLTVTDAGGLSGSDTLLVTVANAAPVVDAGNPQPAYTGVPVMLGGAFTDPGTADTHTVVWTFGDGEASADRHPTHTYALAGTYTATLTVTDDDGGVGTDTVTVTVTDPAPVANGDRYETGEGRRLDVPAATGVLSNDRYVPASGATASVVDPPARGALVLAPDGSFSYEPNPLFSGEDSFTYATTSGGQTSAPATVTIAVADLNDPPECAFSFAPASPAPGAEVRFADLSVDRDGHVAAWSWEFGDGATSSVQGPAHAYAAEGTYRVVLTVTDDLGATAEYIDFVPVRYTAPVARDDAYSVDEGSTLTVVPPGVLGNDGDLVATVSVAAPVSGPAHGTLALSPDGSFTYVPAAGYSGPDSFTYTVATGSQGSTAATVAIAVAPLNRPPTAAFAFSPPAPTTIDTISFNDDGSLDPDGAIAAYSWDFGDGSPSAQGASAAHRFATPGSHRVTLTVIDGEGLAASAARDLHVTAYEAATFEPTPPGTTVSGRQIVIDTAGAESAGGTVAVTGDRITITYGGLVTTITTTGPPASAGGVISAEIASVTVESDRLPGEYSSTGPVEASFAAHLDEFAQGATIAAALRESLEPDVSSAFELAATGQGLVLRDVAYAMTVEKAGIPAGAVTGATVRMTAGAAWVAAQGGAESIRIVRYDDAGAITFLETAAEDLGNGLFRFTAESPGLSVFALAGVTEETPTAVDDAYDATAGRALAVPAPGVLANDGNVATATATVAAGPSHGTLALNGDGSFTYTPAAGFAGEDTFTYTVAVGSQASPPATVRITVTEPAPVTITGPIIITQPGTYRLEADILDFPNWYLITVRSSNVVIEGNGHRIDGMGKTTQEGIYIEEATGAELENIVIKDLVCTDWQTAIFSTKLRSLEVRNVRFENDNSGIYLTETSDARITDCQFSANRLRGIEGVGSANPTIEGCTFERTLESISLRQCAGPMIRDNRITGGTYAVAVNGAPSAPIDAVIDGNTIGGATYGIYLYYITGAEITANTIRSNAEGIRMGQSTGSTIAGNTITANTNFGLGLSPSQGNTIANNRFENAVNVHHFEPCTNTWAFSPQPGPNIIGGPSLGGNYWGAPDGTGFSDTAGDLDSDGFADTAYAAEYVNDPHPLVPVGQRPPVPPDASFTASPLSGPAPLAVHFADTSTGSSPTSRSWEFGGAAPPSSEPTADVVFAHPGAVTVTLTVSNAYGSDTATATITVTDPAPVAVGDVYAVAEDATLSVPAPGLLANDADPDGDPLTATAGDPPLHGTVVVNPDGSFTYTPAPDYSGADSFTYTASDGPHQSGPATVAITVSPANDLPTAAGDGYATDEDTVLRIASPGVLANDIDRDGDALAAALVTAPAHGTLALAADGSFAYTPAPDFDGEDSFTYTASDGAGPSGAATVAIAVTWVNDAPVAAPAAATTDEGSAVAITLAGSDADGDALSYAIATPPGHGTLSGTAPVLSYLPGAGFAGTDEFTFTVSDGRTTSAPATVTIAVENVNDAPTALAQSLTTAEDSPSAVTLAGSDPDGDALAYRVVAGPAHGSLSGAAPGLVYTPARDFYGDDSFTFEVSDGPSTSAGATVSITVTAVNDAPTAADDRYAAREDTTLAIATAAGVLANDADVDDDTLAAALVSGPAHGSAALNPDGSFSYTPAPNYNGADSFTYRADDGRESAAATVSIEVGPVADEVVPVDDGYATPEDTPLAVPAPGVLGNDRNDDGSVIGAALGDGVAHGTLELREDGSFTYTPNEDWNGRDSFTYTCGDAPAATVSITVSPVNDAPTARADAYSTSEGAALIVARETGVLVNDADPDGDTLRASVRTPTAHGTLSLGGDGSFVYAPAAKFAGTDTFTYAAEDGTTDSATVTVTITVHAVNDPPVATGDSYTGTEDSTLTIGAPGVLGNDLDPEGTALRTVLESGPATGDLALDEDGSFTYTPAADENGRITFSYRASDGQLTSNPVVVAISLSPVNDPPVPAADGFATDEDTALVVAAPGVLANDRDVDGDALGASVESRPAHGILSLERDGSFRYEPARNYNGPDGFTYRVSDGTDSATVSVGLTVIPVTDPASPAADAFGTDEDTALVVGAPGVLGNDPNPDEITLSATLVDGVAHGALALAAGGSFTYTPDEDWNGQDTFTYSVGGSGPATVTITVRAVNDAPAARADSYGTSEGTVLTVPAERGVLVNDADPDSAAITASLAAGPAHGTLVLQPDGSFVYTSVAGYDGPDSFTYRASDGSLASGTATVSITVDAVNGAPVAGDDAYTATAGTALTVAAADGVLGDDRDPDGDALSAHLVAPPAHGTVVLGTDGSFTYTPAAGFAGTDSFTYRANDGREDSNTATVTIAVSAANHAPTPRDDAYSTGAGTLLVVAKPGVLANDDDADDDALTAALVETVAHGTLALSADGSFAYTPAAGFSGADTFTYRAHDGAAGSGPATVRIAVQPAANRPPEITAPIAVPVDPKPVNTAIMASAAVADPDAGDTVTATWAWGDGTTSTVRPASGTVAGSHTYTAAGVYTVELSVTDGTAGTSAAAPQYTVVYDPNGGFVTGGGWIASPPGAYAANPSLTGKASFGFVSKYKKGQAVPTGETGFQFHVAGMDFESSSYEWLVIANSKAQYKGAGTINGAGSYGFMLSAIDGDLSKVRGPDTFRIKIWDRNNRDAIVYDNQVGAGDSADPTTTLGGGSVVVHKA